MTQRNPMNERYTSEDRKGTTRKSAASAKPKTKAAASVRIQPTEKTKEQKKAERKAERAKRSERDREFYNPPTERYKKLRRLWWVLLGGAIVLTVFSFVGQQWFPAEATYVTLGLAYVFIIGALYVDFSKCRKERQRYADEVMAHKTKSQRAAEKQQKAAERAAKAEAESAPAAEEPKKRGLAGLFGKKSQ